ncbi:MAG TPA: glycosyltransferase family 39 protein [Methylomirabilota bacterium]|nr:glycosyltransferase family 39 protein [Methylomirabilota bacterium]
MTATLVIGLGFVLAGAAAAPAWIVAALDAPDTPARLTGALLFKVGLVALGVTTAALGWWQRRLTASAPGHGEGRASESRGALAGLAGVLVVAGLLRLYRLDAGLWYDEIVVYVQYARMPFGQLVSTYTSESQHFLFNVLAHGAVSVLGESAWAVRLPAALFGIASIPALYLFARRVTGAHEALLAAALMTVSYHHVWFSQNARGYTGLLFFTLLSSWLLLRSLDGARLGPWLAYAAAAALGAYTHVTMLFVVAVQFAIAVVTVARRRDRALATSMLAAFWVTALLTFQLYALVLPQFVGTIGQHTEVVDWKSPLWTVLELARGMRVGVVGGAVAVVGGLVFLAGLASFARRAPVLVALLVGPPTVGAALVLGMGHPLWPRFFFFVFGFVLLVVVRGVTVVGGAGGRLLAVPAAVQPRLGMAMAVGLIVLSAASVPAAYAPKQDYQGALAFVEGAKEPGDAVVTVGLATFPYRSFFKVDWDAADSAEQLGQIREQAKRTWVVYTIPLHLRFEHPDIMTVLEREFSVVKRFSGTLSGGVLVVCRADAAGGRGQAGRL